MKKYQPQLGGILLTKDRSIESLRDGIDKGFQDVLTSPLNPNRLRASVEMVAGEHSVQPSTSLNILAKAAAARGHKTEYVRPPH